MTLRDFSMVGCVDRAGLGLDFLDRIPQIGAMEKTRRILSSLLSLRERRLARRRPSGLQFAFADSIDALRPDHWDAACEGQSFFLRREVLQVIEDVGPENLRPQYALAYEDGEPVAAIAAQIVEITGDRLRSVKVESSETRTNLLKRALKPAKAAASERLKQRMLVAGNLMSWGFHGIAFRPGHNPTELWPAIGEALYRIRRSAKLEGQTQLVMVKDLTDAQGDLDGLHRLSYRPLETEPNMVLTMDPAWTHYDAYMAALDAKYRRNAKDQLKKLTASGCTLEPLVDLEAEAGRLHELYLSVHEKASVRLVTLTKEFLPQLAKVAGKDFHCTVARQQGRVMGFVTAIRDGDTAIAYYIGFDRELAAQGVPVYLRLLHSTIDQAIQWKCKQLSLGRTALEPKAAMGAKPQTMSVWIRHRVPALNWVLRGILNTVDHDEAPERNPFKASEPGGAR